MYFINLLLPFGRNKDDINKAWSLVAAAAVVVIDVHLLMPTRGA